MPGPGGVVVGVRAGVDGDGPAARVVGGAEHDLELHAVAVGQGERRFQGEFVEQAAADLVAKPRRTSSTKAVPGSRTVPATVWSASQGWARVESRPVSRTRSSSATRTTAPSKGCPVPMSPAPVTSPVLSAGLSQYRSRVNA